VASFRITPASEVRFVNNGEQLCFLMAVTYAGDETGIKTVSSASAEQRPDQYYNLMGQPVPSHTRGVLICKGKKVIR